MDDYDKHEEEFNEEEMLQNSEEEEEINEEEQWNIDPRYLEPEEVQPSINDEIIKALDSDATAPTDVALKNFAASFANLTSEDIEELTLLSELYEECVKFASVPIGAILPEEVLELKINSMRRKIALSRAKAGKMMDLFLKHWTVVSHTKELADIQPDKPSWFRKLARMFK